MVDRVFRLQRHDDGLNVWETARIGPPAALSGQLYGYADYRERTGAFTTRRELPHAEGVLIVNLGSPIAITGGDGAMVRLGPGEAFAAGVHVRPALSQSLGAQAGMHVLLPLVTLRRLLGLPMDQLADKVLRLDELLGAEATGLGTRLCEAPDREARMALLDAALASWLARAAPLRSQTMHALAMLRHRPECDIAEIARDIGWSRKHLAHVVRETVGVGPRSFRRLLRFQALLGTIAAEPACGWAVLAHECGYCDQAHMIREFREFSGMTPATYVARSLPDGGGLVEQ